MPRMRRRALLQMMALGPQRGILSKEAAALLLCAGLLAGCGASLNSASVNSELQTGAITHELDGDKTSDASASTAARSSTSKNAPASLATAVAPKPQSPSVGPAQVAGFAKAAEPFTSSATPGSMAYKIGPQDILEVSVFKVPELTRTVQVAEVGTINLPLVGEVAAAGKTARDIERDLTTKLGSKYLQSPQVTVAVKEYNSQRVTIEGAVKKPGVYPIRSKTTLLQLTAMAQGLTDAADHSGLVIIRQANGKRSAQKFNIDEIRSGQTADPAVKQGDIVVVSHSQMKAAWQTFLTGIGAAGRAAVFF